MRRAVLNMWLLKSKAARETNLLPVQLSLPRSWPLLGRVSEAKRKEDWLKLLHSPGCSENLGGKGGQRNGS